MKSFEVYIGNDNLIFAENDLIQIRWSPISIFPVEQPNMYNVDIHLMEMNAATGNFQRLLTLASNIPNTGIKDVRMPAVPTVASDGWEEALSSVVVQVSIANNYIDDTTTPVTNIFGRLGQLEQIIGKFSAVRYVRKVARQILQQAACELWGALEPLNTGQDILNRLPSCPTRIRIPNSGFKEEQFSSISPVIGEVQTGIGNIELPFFGIVGDHLGYTVIDDKVREFFNPGTTNCYRQRVTTL